MDKEQIKKLLCKKITISDLKILPILVISFILPLLVRLNIIVNYNSEINSIEMRLAKTDYFTYYKSKLLILTAAICLTIEIYYFLKNKFRMKLSSYILVSFFVILLIIISYFNSTNKNISLWGIEGQFEGTLSVISYYIIFIYVLTFIDNDKIRLLIKTMIYSVFIISIIGIFEYFDIFLLDAPIFKLLIFGNYYPNFYTLNMKTKMQMTIGYYNVVGEYMALFISLLFGFILYDFPFKGKRIGFLYITYYLLCFSWILCGSRGGLFGGLFGILLNLFLYRKKIKKNNKKVLILTASTVALLFLLTPYAKTNILSRMDSEKNAITTDYTSGWLMDIKGGEGQLVLTLKNSKIVIKNENNRIYIYKDNELVKSDLQLVGGNKDLKKYSISDKCLEGLRIQEAENLFNKRQLLLNYNGLQISLNDNMEIINWKGKPIIYNDIPHIEVGKYGRLLNGRVYLWSRILPIIKDHPLLGIGADCLIFEYPQYDILGQMKYFGSNSNYLTLCHNHFIQIAVNHGLLALAVYLVLLYMCLYYHRPEKESKEASLYYCFASAILGYLLSTMVMDSSVSVAPLAWMCLGICVVLKEHAYLSNN